jgi:Domain of unknown function (DUF4091)
MNGLCYRGVCLPIMAIAIVALDQLPSAISSHAASTQSSRNLVVWANDGGDKVLRHELRAVHDPRSVLNTVWTGHEVRLFAARNEVISANIVIEASNGAVSTAVRMSDLEGPRGTVLRSRRGFGTASMFDWTEREVEVFIVRYLQIRGLSRLAYGTYDERHVPERLRRPIGDNGPRGGWTDRPAHDKEFPDIAVPIELVPRFDIPTGTNQSVWLDIYVPKSAPPGVYSGVMQIISASAGDYSVPVRLHVRAFELPDTPSTRTMIATSYAEVARRYTGNAYPAANTPADRLTRLVMDRQAAVAHRHRVSLIDDNGGAEPWSKDEPRPNWLPRLDGSLFTRARGYAGPGEGKSSGVFSIGTYGMWKDWWRNPTAEVLRQHANAWELWFRANAPDVERFLYLADESNDFLRLETLAGWLKGAGSSEAALPTFATIDLLKARAFVPSLDIVGSWFTVGATDAWQVAALDTRTSQKLFLYNGFRPASGTFATEDDGVALREIAWGQYKKRIDRWFYWNSTYYNNYQGGLGDTDVFRQAQTFGGPTKRDPVTGETGWNSTNGDGVLFYPGTDRIFPSSSYDLEGPIASLRLKHWRRGIQDVEYLALAAKIDPSATMGIVHRMVPKVLWEIGVGSTADPTWVREPISWSTDPDDWERARLELAEIIDPS